MFADQGMEGGLRQGWNNNTLFRYLVVDSVSTAKARKGELEKDLKYAK